MKLTRYLQRRARHFNKVHKKDRRIEDFMALIVLIGVAAILYSIFEGIKDQGRKRYL